MKKWVLLLLVTLPACSQLIYTDDFEQPRPEQWQFSADSLGQSQIVDGAITIDLTAARSLQYALLNDQLVDSFTATVDANYLGTASDASYGMLFQVQEDGSFYRFDVTADGYFVVEQHNADGSWTRLSDGWVASQAIQRGSGATNRLKVTVNGSRITVFANDQLLQRYDVRDQLLGVGRIGLDVGTFRVGDAHVRFDNLEIRTPTR